MGKRKKNIGGFKILKKKNTHHNLKHNENKLMEAADAIYVNALSQFKGGKTGFRILFNASLQKLDEIMKSRFKHFNVDEASETDKTDYHIIMSLYDKLFDAKTLFDTPGYEFLPENYLRLMLDMIPLFRK